MDIINTQTKREGQIFSWNIIRNELNQYFGNKMKRRHCSLNTTSNLKKTLTITEIAIVLSLSIGPIYYVFTIFYIPNLFCLFRTPNA